MTLPILWFIIIAVLICAYYVLDGFDLGSGILSPFIAKTDGEKNAILRAIGPVWDGNEVWLLTAGGALFAAFAPAYASVFSGFYLAIMLVLFGLIVRAVSLEFRAHDASWRKLWDVLFFVGSLVPALLFGVALGNCLQGVPLDAAGNYIGSFFGLLTPFPLVCGLLGLATIITQGACWLSAKIEKGTYLQRRAVRARTIMQIVSAILCALVAVMYFAMVGFRPGEETLTALLVLVGIIQIVAIVAGFFGGGMNRDWLAFGANSLLCVALVAAIAIALFPNLVVSAGPGPSIDLVSAASSTYGLTVMTIIACIGVPLVAIYHVIIYRTFRGTIHVDED